MAEWTTTILRPDASQGEGMVAGGRENNLRDLRSWIFYFSVTIALIGKDLA